MKTVFELPIEYQRPLYAILGISILLAICIGGALYYIIKSAVRDGVREAMAAQPMSPEFAKAHNEHTKRLDPVTQPLDFNATR